MNTQNLKLDDLILFLQAVRRTEGNVSVIEKHKNKFAMFKLLCSPRIKLHIEESTFKKEE